SEKPIYNLESQPFKISDAPGLTVFFRDSDGSIYETYSTFARGLDMFVTAYHFLDVTPKGRNEEEEGGGMSWVRHHDRYGQGEFEAPWANVSINSVRA